MFLAAGLCFKVAAVPFHVWTPDVYVGAPTPVTAFLSTASKAAAFAIFARIFYTALPHIETDWNAVIATVAALSMIVGNLAAVTQDNIKRMLAWSSIGSAGYALLGILAMSEIGLQGVLVYMIVYAFATLGIWAAVLMLRQHEYAGEQIDDFAGLHRRAPAVAFAMVVFLLSLGGIPPTAGFIGKYFLFAAAISAGYSWLAVIAVLMSAVSMFYYLRVVVAMYLKDGRDAEVEPSPRLRFAVAVCLVATLALGILPETMIKGVRESLGVVVQIAGK
jgi:NADH-quinone oxidoreductase subunit N